MATQNVTTTSGIFSLSWRDAAKGFLVAAITAIIASVGQGIEAGTLPTVAQLKIAGLAGLTAGISYLIKNLLSPASITVTNPPADSVAAVKSGDATVTITPTK